MSESKVVEKTKMPATIESLQTDLRTLGVRPGMVVLVHSSLSAMGWVCGGAVAVVIALQEAIDFLNFSISEVSKTEVYRQVINNDFIGKNDPRANGKRHYY